MLSFRPGTRSSVSLLLATILTSALLGAAPAPAQTATVPNSFRVYENRPAPPLLFGLVGDERKLVRDPGTGDVSVGDSIPLVEDFSGQTYPTALSGTPLRAVTGEWDARGTLAGSVDHGKDGTETLVVNADGSAHLLDDLVGGETQVAGESGPVAKRSFDALHTWPASDQITAAAFVYWDSDAAKEIVVASDASDRLKLYNQGPDGGVTLVGELQATDYPTTMLARPANYRVTSISELDELGEYIATAVSGPDAGGQYHVHLLHLGSAAGISELANVSVGYEVADAVALGRVDDYLFLSAVAADGAGAPIFRIYTVGGSNATTRSATAIYPTASDTARCTGTGGDRATLAVAFAAGRALGGCLQIEEETLTDGSGTYPTSADAVLFDVRDGATAGAAPLVTVTEHRLGPLGLVGEVGSPELHFLARTHDLRGTPLAAAELLVAGAFVYDYRDPFDEVEARAMRLHGIAFTAGADGLTTAPPTPIRTVPTVSLLAEQTPQAGAPCCFVLAPTVPVGNSLTMQVVRPDVPLDSDSEIVVPIAVLSAPPQVRGLDQAALAPPIFTTGRTISQEEGHGLEVSASIIMQAEFTDPIFDLGAEVEASLTAAFGNDWSESHEVTIEDMYIGTVTDDSVVAMHTTFDDYDYDVDYSTLGPVLGKDLMFSLPDETRITIYSRREFVRRFPQLGLGHDLSRLLGHSIGNPGTYLARNDLDDYCDDLPSEIPTETEQPMLESGLHEVRELEGSSEGSRVSMRRSNTTTRSWNVTLASSVMLGGKIKGGFGLSAGYGGSWSRSVGTSTAFEGYVGHVPHNVAVHDEQYEWRLFVCRATLGPYPIWVQNWTVQDYAEDPDDSGPQLGGRGGHTALGQVGLTYPVRYDDVPTTPTLEWTVSGSVFEQEVELEAIGGVTDRRVFPDLPGGGVLDLTTEDVQELEITEALRSGTTYRWRVRSFDFIGNAETSDWEHFTAWEAASGEIVIQPPIVHQDRTVGIDWTPPPGSRGWRYNVAVLDGEGDILASSEGLSSTHWRTSVSFAPGPYTARVIGETPQGATEPIERGFRVRNRRPEADFTFAPTAPLTSETVEFADISEDVDGAVAAWRWDFGDGGTATDQHPSHRFRRAGSYRVSLQVTDDEGGVDELTRVIEVAPGPGSTCPGLGSVRGNHIVGTSGQDLLVGTAGRDVICGLGGRDEIRGLAGDDLLVGGSGRDLLLGGTGDDRIRGGTDADSLSGSWGHDHLLGEGGRDELYAGPGRDVLDGGASPFDACYGTRGRTVYRGCERQG